MWWPQPPPVRASRANARWRSRRCRCGSWVAELVATQAVRLGELLQPSASPVVASSPACSTGLM
eukprot:6753250-Alexandrium_andersonii.AAC.1